MTAAAVGRVRFPGVRFLLAAGLLTLGACTRRPVSGTRGVRRPEPVRVVPPPLARLGYTVQVGAFAEVVNAARLAGSLQAQGLDATYYRGSQGLFRVRFGDFPTKDAARSRAEALRSARVIQEFHVARPDEPTTGLKPPENEAELRRNLVATARTFLGVPYLWGGTTELGFDCSGLAMAVYQLNGLRLPRTSREQYEAGTAVPLEKAQAGDLVFFAMGRSGQVSHVGIYAGEGQFIHAPGAGRTIGLADLTGPGRSLVGVRRYL